MSSWTNIYFFPESGSNLNPEAAFGVIRNLKLQIDNDYVLMKKNSEGLCVEGDFTVFKEDSIDKEVFNLLSESISIQLMFRNQFFYLSCIFALCGNTPYISLNWPRKRYFNSSDIFRNELDETVIKMAEMAGVAFVFFLNDAPDFFEERLLFYDKDVLLDFPNDKSNFPEIEKIWINEKKGGMVPQELKVSYNKTIGKMFKEFKII